VCPEIPDETYIEVQVNIYQPNGTPHLLITCMFSMVNEWNSSFSSDAPMLFDPLLATNEDNMQSTVTTDTTTSSPNKQKRLDPLAEHLLDTLPVSQLCHLTFQRRASEEQRNTAWTEFIDEVGKESRRQFGWIRADETDAKGNRHIHAAIVSFVPPDRRLVEDSWNKVNGNQERNHALVEKYDVKEHGASGLSYILSPESTVTFSENIELYSSQTDPHDLSSSERRSYSRIRS
jgi:hypothetical protein